MRALTLTLAGLISTGALAAEPGRIIDKVVAVVNDEVITWSELEEATAPFIAEIESIADPSLREAQRLRQLKQTLEELIGQQLIEQEAKSRRIEVTDNDVDAYLERVKAQQGWDDTKLEIYLTGQGLDVDLFRAQVKEKLLHQKTVRVLVGGRIRISDGDLEAFYKEELTRSSSGFDVESAHILFSLSPEASPQEIEARRIEATAILARARAGEDFAALASAHGDGSSAKNGGGLGVVQRGRFDPVLETALFALAPGELGGPVRTRFGWHILKCVAHRKRPTPSFEEMKAELRVQLMDQRLNQELKRWIASLKEKAFVEVRL
ncbi:peptidylprolyl isomerase [Myxococcota bacterium]|nr:peptidylprolyl isomerase [Myxococcota bacterium]MBU1429335.1 peptidylprolyl isomerase [Myxococcota bacterium]MBU1898950.1 peptidylprolyl isomerase [Myxococcota bacterium]